MILKKIFERKPEPEQRLYEVIVASARQPRFYEAMAVPDTVDGRFDMITLHLFLVLRRLKQAGEEPFRQALVDVFFRDMDRSLREMGVGDLSVGKKVRKMAEVFYGRLLAYDEALTESPDALIAALARNIYAGINADAAPKLAEWVLAAQESLLLQSPADITSAQVTFSA